MTKGTSTRRKNGLPGYLYGNFDPGDQDKLMITYARDQTQDYTLNGACGVIYKGNIHFFGGDWPRSAYFRGSPYTNLTVKYYEAIRNNLRKQHLTIETHRSGRIPKLIRMKDLD